MYSDENLTNKIATINTDENGYGIVSGLQEGKYYLKEIKNSLDYKANMNIITVNIDTDKDYTDVNIISKRAGLLPSTGGIGTYIFIIFGMFLIIFAILLFYYKIKKVDAIN